MLLSWVFFLLAAAVALLAPAALGLAYESRIRPVLTGAFVINSS